MWRRALVAAAAATALGAPPASAEQRVVVIDTPSEHVRPADVTFNPGGALKASVLLPDGYDERPAERWPVLFLLHGVGDTHTTWLTKGGARRAAKDFPGIVVMPDAARGFYLNWWRGGRRGGPGWERFFLDELIGQVEQRYRVRPGRRWHAIAGVSMGGLGTAYLAGQAPGYFGSAAVFSGFVNPDNPMVNAFFQAVVPEASFEDIWGPPDGFYAIAHDPTRTPGNLRRTRLWVTTGDGVAEPEAGDGPQAATVGAGAEAVVVKPQVDAFVAATRAAGVPITYVPHHGVHEWGWYWERALREAIAWDLFAPVEESPSTWTYRTTADRGRAWDVDYRFAAPPEGIAVLRRAGDRLEVDGVRGALTLGRAPGCETQVTAPWSGPLPAATCGRLGVGLRPRRVTAGRRTRLRIAVTRSAGGRRFPVAGALVRVGRRVVRTGDSGIARMTVRLARAARVRARTPGLAAATTVLPIRRPRIRP